MEIPLSAFGTPDTLRLDVQSSIWPVDASNLGSRLIIDEMQLKSKPLNTGIFAQMMSAKPVLIYPNPTFDNLNIRLECAQAENLKVSVYDIAGHIISVQEFDAVSGENNICLQVNELPAGTYYSQITGEVSGSISRGTFVKK